MKLVDILPIEKWIKLEKEIHKRSGLNASVFDSSGTRITNFQKWANKLCPLVKANMNGQSFICAIAHQNAANQARQTRMPAVIECDAGLVKMVVPIFIDDEFLGVAGGCGQLQDGGEVDTFLINKVTGIAMEEIECRSSDMKTITTDGIYSLVEYIEEEIAWIIHDFENRQAIMAG